jgi:hypothetical protein
MIESCFNASGQACIQPNALRIDASSTNATWFQAHNHAAKTGICAHSSRITNGHSSDVMLNE